ncbi:MAG: hypothetical protein JSW10_12050, partial [Pseudomonadota bacterium]
MDARICPRARLEYRQNSAMQIVDPWNPSNDEIEAWAFDSSELEPIEDWDFALVWKREENLYLALASNVLCPKRQYFLHVLYLT